MFPGWNRLRGGESERDGSQERVAELSDAIGRAWPTANSRCRQPWRAPARVGLTRSSFPDIMPITQGVAPLELGATARSTHRAVGGRPRGRGIFVGMLAGGNGSYHHARRSWKISILFL